MISGRLLSGIEFDTNMMFGSAYSKTFDIVIGAGKMIRGMDAALKTMRVGEQAKVCTMFFSIFYLCSYSENCTRQFRFREDYAYGEEGSPARGTAPAIPSKASIEFEIELVSRSGSTCGLSAADAKKLAEDERRAALIAIREEKARLRKDEELRKEEEKSLKKKGKDKSGPPESDLKVDADVTIVHDARWAKSLKPNDLKQELKTRGLSTQGAKKELLSRLIAYLVEKNGS
jgi:hypothetical protein